jgi:hypothetical protein
MRFKNTFHQYENYLSIVLHVLTHIPITVYEIMEKLELPRSKINEVVEALKQGINEGKVIIFEDPLNHTQWIGAKYALAERNRGMRMCFRGDIPSDMNISAERKHFSF